MMNICKPMILGHTPPQKKSFYQIWNSFDNYVSCHLLNVLWLQMILIMKVNSITVTQKHKYLA